MYNQKCLKNLEPFTPVSWYTANKAYGGSTVIRVPTKLAAAILEYAHKLDIEAVQSQALELVNSEGETAILATESDGTDEDEWIEEVLGFKMNPDGTIPQEVQEEIDRIKNGEPQETQQELQLTKEEFTQIHGDIKRGGCEYDEDKDRAYDPEKWAERQTYYDVNRYTQSLIGDEFQTYHYNEEGIKITTHIDHKARREKLNKLTEAPETKDWQLKRFARNLEIGEYVWEVAAPEQDDFTPNYYKMRISPEKFDRIATFLINYKKGEQVSIDDCCRSWAYEETYQKAKQVIEEAEGEEELQRLMELQWEVERGIAIFFDTAEEIETGKTGEVDFSDTDTWTAKTFSGYYADALVASSELTRVTTNMEKAENRQQKRASRIAAQTIRPHELLTPKIIATHGPNYGSAGWIMEMQLSGNNWNKEQYVGFVAQEAYNGNSEAQDELAVLRAHGWDIPAPTKKQRKKAKSRGKLAEMAGKR